jgi:hypothetical protein
LGLQDRREQTIEGLGSGNTLQAIFNHTHLDSLGLVTSIR